MKKDQQGFSIVELLLIVLIVVLLGVLGWLVYSKHLSKTTKPPAANAQTVSGIPANIENIFGLLQSQDTTIKWGAITPKKNISGVFFFSQSPNADESSLQENGYVRQGTKMTSTLDSGGNSMGETNMGNQTGLENAGWTPDDYLSGDSPYSTAWGYMRTINGKTQFLSIQTISPTAEHNLTSPSSSQIVGPATFDYTVSLSDPF